MIPLFPSLRFLASVFCLLIVSVRAQTPPSEEPKPANLRFLFLDEKPGSYSLKSGQAQRQISYAPYAISTPITVLPKGRLDIYQTPTLPDPVTGKKEPVKIASLTPPATLTSALVVVTPRPPTPESPVPPPPDITYFDTSIEAFPAGSIRVINLGRSPLGTKFDKVAPFLLQPGETRIVSPTPDSKNRVVVKIAVSEGDAWKLLSNKIAILKPGQRMTGVFVYSPSGLLHTYTAEELAEFGKPKPGHFWLTYTDTP
jgi:hypothetical protein